MKGNRLLLVYGGMAGVLLVIMIVATVFTPRFYDDAYYAEQTAYIAAQPTATPIITVGQVIAMQVIPAGTTIDTQMIAVRQIPLTAAVRGGYSDLSSVTGSVADVEIGREQVITAAMLQEPEPPPNFRATLTAEAPGSAPVRSMTVTPALLPSPTPVQYAYLVVPIYDIPAGTLITAQDVYAQPYLAENAPFDALDSSNDVIGYVTTVDLPRNYPVLRNTLMVAGQGTPTPAPATPSPDDCVVSATYSASLYDEPDNRSYNGTARPNTDFIVVEAVDRHYLVTLPGGHEIGWIHQNDVQKSGNCDDF